MKSFKERWQELSLKNKIFSIIIFLGVCVMIVLTVLPSKEKESVEDEIKRKNKELGLLTVMEVVSKDCIYLTRLSTFARIVVKTSPYSGFLLSFHYRAP